MVAGFLPTVTVPKSFMLTVRCGKEYEPPEKLVGGWCVSVAT